ncbi:MAG TPA: hypothetical protein VIR29_13115 [Anseongella sp.]
MKKHRLIPVAAIAVTLAAFTINAPQAFPETTFQGLSADTLPGDTIDDPLPADTSGLPDDTLPADTSVFPPEDFFPQIQQSMTYSLRTKRILSR